MYKPKKHDPKECIICGSVFVPRRSNQMTCGSSKCKRARQNVRQNEWRKQNYNTPDVSEPQKLKEDTIVAIGYADRQIKNTLSKVPKIDTTL